MKFKNLFFTLVFFTLPVFADTQTEILSDKLNRLESEMAFIQKALYQKTPEQNTENKLPNNIDEFYTSLDNQNKTIQDLTDKNEQMAHEIDELKNQLKCLNEDVNFRFNELKNNSFSQNPPPSPETKENISEIDAYEKAYQFLKNGEYEKAEQSFIVFMEKYPKGKMIGNANYWLGESYYARQKWNEAAGLFADGFTKYKDNNKATDSMFKLGLTMKQLKKKTEACTAFKSLLENYKDLNKTLKERTQAEVKELKCP